MPSGEDRIEGEGSSRGGGREEMIVVFTCWRNAWLLCSCSWHLISFVARSSFVTLFGIVLIIQIFVIIVVFVVIRRSIIIIIHLAILLLVIIFISVDVGLDVAFVVLQIDPIAGRLVVRRAETDDEEGQSPDEKGAIQHPLGAPGIEQHLLSSSSRSDLSPRLLLFDHRPPC